MPLKTQCTRCRAWLDPLRSTPKHTNKQNNFIIVKKTKATYTPRLDRYEEDFFSLGYNYGKNGFALRALRVS